jgi:soluble P-type ATPase
MKAAIIALVAAGSIAGVAHAGATDKQFVEASRCSALAASENLGKLDTTAVDAFLLTESADRKGSVRIEAVTKMNNARKKADSAGEGAKAKLIAERDQICAPYIGSAQATR